MTVIQRWKKKKNKNKAGERERKKKEKPYKEKKEEGGNKEKNEVEALEAIKTRRGSWKARQNISIRKTHAKIQIYCLLSEW